MEKPTFTPQKGSARAIRNFCILRYVGTGIQL